MTSTIRAIKSGERAALWAVKRIKSEQQPTTHEIAHCELDTRADTTCAGINCHLLFFTGQQCEVRGFYDDFEPVTNVPIATVATAWCDGLGGPTYILILNEALYFGDTMGHSLMNPNQLWYHGIRVHDNPFETNPGRQIGIELYDDVRLPFLTEESTIFFDPS